MDFAHAKIYVNDTEIKARSLKLDMAVDMVHSATIECSCCPEIECESWVTYGFTPETVEESLKIIESALENGTEWDKVNLLTRILDICYNSGTKTLKNSDKGVSPSGEGMAL